MKHEKFKKNFSALGYEALDMTDVDERVAARKQRYLRLYTKFNFFGFG